MPLLFRSVKIAPVPFSKREGTAGQIQKQCVRFVSTIIENLKKPIDGEAYCW